MAMKKSSCGSKMGTSKMAASKKSSMKPAMAGKMMYSKKAKK
jgi:hypothetical protein